MAENDLGVKQISNATLEVCPDFEGGPLVFNVRASVLPPQDLFIVYVDGVAAAQLADVNEFDELGLELEPGPHIVDFSYQYNIFSLDPDSPELENIPSKILGAVWIDFVQLGDVAPLPTYSPTKSDVVTNSPTISFKPSAEVFPSISPSVSMMPTNVTITTISPSYEPSLSPTNSSEPSSAPSFMPSTSLKPSISLEPSISAKPSGTLPTVKPTADPTQQPSTLEPTQDPTVDPTPQPTLQPTVEPVSSLIRA